MTWAYDPHSRTVYTIDATESDDGVIARDVPPEFGALIAAAGEMREALAGLIGLVELVAPTLSGRQKNGVEQNHRLETARAILARTEPQS